MLNIDCKDSKATTVNFIAYFGLLFSKLLPFNHANEDLGLTNIKTHSDEK